MKKVYTTPHSRIFEFDAEEGLMAGSDGFVTMRVGSSSNTASNDDADADSYRSNLWDD